MRWARRGDDGTLRLKARGDTWRPTGQWMTRAAGRGSWVVFRTVGWLLESLGAEDGREEGEHGSCRCSTVDKYYRL